MLHWCILIILKVYFNAIISQTKIFFMTIKNLVFKGGGVLGIAYSGALQVLQDQGMLAGIKKVAGTSAGSITAAAVSLNYSAEEITAIVSKTNFKSFEDGWNPLHIPTRYGLYEGKTLLTLVQQFITGKGLAANATFADFKAHGCKDLHVFATDLDIRDIKEFSFEQTPDTIVAEAVRASMSIPLFFEAWQFTNGHPNNHLFVDGGVVLNYPLTIFDNGAEPNPETLGFYLTNLQNVPATDGLKFDQIGDYVKFLFETLLDSQDVDFDTDPSMEARTVKIDNLGISATDFNITDVQEQALYQSGKECAEAYLRSH